MGKDFIRDFRDRFFRIPEEIAELVEFAGLRVYIIRTNPAHPMRAAGVGFIGQPDR